LTAHGARRDAERVQTIALERATQWAGRDAPPAPALGTVSPAAKLGRGGAAVARRGRTPERVR